MVGDIYFFLLNQDNDCKYNPQMAAAFVKNVVNITAVSELSLWYFLKIDVFIECLGMMKSFCYSMMRWSWWMRSAHVIRSVLPLR